MWYIYFIENLVNGKIYVGYTVNLKKRWNRHHADLLRNKHENPHLQAAWNLYGESGFDHYIVDSILTKEERDTVERTLILWFKEIGLSYNIQNGGDGPGKMTLETREKLRQAGLGKKQPAEVRQKIDTANRLNVKERIAKTMETKRKRLEEDPNCYKHTEEAKKKIGLGHKGVKPSPLCIENSVKARLGKKLTPEHIEKVLLSKKARAEERKDLANVEAINKEDLYEDNSTS